MAPRQLLTGLLTGVPPGSLADADAANIGQAIGIVLQRHPNGEAKLLFGIEPVRDVLAECLAAAQLPRTVSSVVDAVVYLCDGSLHNRRVFGTPALLYELDRLAALPHDPPVAQQLQRARQMLLNHQDMC